MMGPHFTQKGNYLADIKTTDLFLCIERVLTIVMRLPRGDTFTSLVGQSSGVFKSVNTLDSFKITSSVISYMYFFGLVKIIRAADTESGMMQVVPVYVCDEKILAYIAQARFLPPMVCMPRELTHNKSCGYLTKENESLILKGYNHHDGNICLDSLTAFNRVAYSLDVRMLTTYNEVPSNPLDTPQKEKQFNKLRDDSYSAFKLLIHDGNNFHFTHKVDKRGRTYSMGYVCNYQGNSFRKSVINLAHKELVNGAFQ
jgi:hypothetical protein